MKRIVSLLIVLCCCFSFSVSAFADSAVLEPVSEVAEESTAQPRAEEVEWVYRVYNGNLEKRLWSNTYGVWKTDWIYCGPAPDVI